MSPDAGLLATVARYRFLLSPSNLMRLEKGIRHSERGWKGLVLSLAQSRNHTQQTRMQTQLPARKSMQARACTQRSKEISLKPWAAENSQKATPCYTHSSHQLANYIATPVVHSPVVYSLSYHWSSFSAQEILPCAKFFYVQGYVCSKAYVYMHTESNTHLRDVGRSGGLDCRKVRRFIGPIIIIEILRYNSIPRGAPCV